jgi:molybdopterin/thiamine biosynthesis adenylyltransferase
MDKITAHQEDILTLRNILGMSDSRAEDILSRTILITANEQTENDVLLSTYIKKILTRTVANVTNLLSENPDIEIVINNATPRTKARIVFVLLDENCVHISINPFDFYQHQSFPHGSLILLSAIYISSFSLRQIIGDNSKLPEMQKNIKIDFNALFPDLTILYSEVIFEKTYLAGGGAIGNAFLYALKEFNVKGEIIIADPDSISDGNLNRCIWFDKSMIEKNKAEVLAEIAQPHFHNLRLKAYPNFLNTIQDRNTDDKWLKKLIIAVDSRRARRNLQTEIPGEVFDASTTNIEEVVFHFHKRPLNGGACLECVYPHDHLENAHEQHIAEALGISLEDISKLNISIEAASKICLKFPNLDQEKIVGQSYDTLFKELCGQDMLKIQNEKEILAPFGFVSLLAGTILAIETVRKLLIPSDYNFWKVSPWLVPIPKLKQLWRSNKKCSFCNNLYKSEFAENLWR